MGKLFLIFYGYLSLSFGWIFYIVVLASFARVIYEIFKTRKKRIYRYSETMGDNNRELEIVEISRIFIRTISFLGMVDLIISTLVALFLTLKFY